ncbi:MAG: hypothetical protein ACRDLP_16310, partial [Solirubrobacteraceae bacterium]
MLLDVARHVAGLGKRKPAREPTRGETLGKLEQSEGVAARLTHDSVADALVEPALDHTLQQRSRILLGQARDRQLGQSGELRLVARLAHRKQDGHRLCQQPSSDKSEDLDRCVVEPLRVVDETQQRSLLGDLRQQAERGEAHKEPLRGIARGEPHCDPQGTLLGARKRVEVGEHRRAQLV